MLFDLPPSSVLLLVQPLLVQFQAVFELVDLLSLQANLRVGVAQFQPDVACDRL